MRAAMQGVPSVHAAGAEAFASEAPWAHYPTMPIMRPRTSPTPREASYTEDTGTRATIGE